MNKYLKLIILLVVCLLLITGTGAYAYKTSKDKKNGKLTVQEFLGINPTPSVKSILVGMTSGLVFGFIDNAGLFFGMDALDPFLPKTKDGNLGLVAAGLGNTFSDGVGAFMGTFSAIIINNLTGVDKFPIISEAFGLILGCLIGVYGPAIILGKLDA
tara:strand:+ start:1440 stop:1910 length:471 start_codon:yes stop_codon:yes gene_type:complete